MKKLLFVLLCMVVFVSLSMAQTYTQGVGLTGIDKLGAHQNGGRGCTGCHAPHSGAFGAGGNPIGGQTKDLYAGDDALWGQDMGPLYGKTLAFGDNGQFTTVLPANFAVADEDIRGIMMCLSCHDGNIAKGAMMQNASWEQANQLLPAGVYGPNPIPTLLANDGTVDAQGKAGNYNNDHPVGTNATLGKVGVASNFLFTAQGCGSNTKFDCLKIDATKTSYVAFANHYGAPNIISNGHGSPVALPDGTSTNAYLLCTTCHTPHSMYVASANADSPINGLTAGKYPTYFFIAAPYNPGSKPTPQQSSSTAQFCRQCHFSGAGGSNEASGINTVTTAF
jgi:hypothetical protein